MYMIKCNRKYWLVKAIFLCCVLLILFSFASTSMAASFQVNSNLDANDLTPGNGLCVAFVVVSPPFVFPFCTLRGAIEEANSLPGEDTIILPPGFFGLSLEGQGEDGSVSGDLDITDDLILQGAGESQTIIDGGQIDRIIDILSPGAVVSLQNLSIMNGMLSEVSNQELYGGGAIRNQGTLTLDNVVLLDHSVQSGQTVGSGGILLNTGSCTITSSTLQGGSADRGGAIYNAQGSNLQIRSTTISRSSAGSGAGMNNQGDLSLLNSTLSNNGNSATSEGGALINTGAATLQHVTLAFNTAQSGGGVSNTGFTSVQNSIMGPNIGGDCSTGSSVISEGANLDTDSTCLLADESDKSGEDPILEPLRNNGGVTMTHLAAPTSPVRDAASLLLNLSRDQRGVTRPQGTGVDMGAVENSPFALPPLFTPLL